MIRPWALADPARDPTPFESAGFLAFNAVQLCIALVSNLILIFGMARKIRLFIAHLTTIVGYYISCFCLVALIALASRFEAGSNPEPVWSQPYYYCLYAAILYFVLASLLLINFLAGCFRHYKQNIVLSIALRTLLLNTVLFLSIVFLGALVFSHIEGWAYLDAVYWADVTLLTIGFGDISPKTTLGRALLLPYTVLGIVCLAITLASIRRLVLDRGELALRKRRLRKMREKFLRESNNNATFSLGDHHSLYTVFVKAREIQSRACRRRRWTAFVLSSTAWLVLLFGGAAIFMACERQSQDWSYFDGIYMAFISLTTVGYGDLTPTSSSGRSFFVLWSLLSVPTITILISNAEGTLLKFVRGITRFIPWLGRQVMRSLRALGLCDGCPAHHDGHLEAEMEQSQARKLPTTRPYYCAILLDEIIGIVRHLNEQPLQNYPFDRWLWFGKLLEGLEHTPETQRKHSREQQEEGGQQKHVAAEGNSPPGQPPLSTGLDIFKFGGFLSNSPLMGPKEEAEWFLERLIEALKRELVRMEN